jgi:hypothetical protein
MISSSKSAKTPKPWPAKILPCLTLCLTIALTGCAHTILILPADRVVVEMRAGKHYAPQFDGYYVPKARMMEILDRLSEKEVFGQ